MKELIEKIEILLKGIVSMTEFDIMRTANRDKKIIFQTRLNLAKDLLDFIAIQKNNIKMIKRLEKETTNEKVSK